MTDSNFRPWRRYAITFAVLLCLLQASTLLPGADQIVDWLVVVYARMAAWWLGAFAGDVRSVGATLMSGEASILTVDHVCSGKEYFVVWFAAVLAYPCRWGIRLIGLTAGLVFLVLLNTLRVATLFLVGIRYPAQFQPLHEDWWSMALTVATIGLLAAWLSFASTRWSPNEA